MNIQLFILRLTCLLGFASMLSASAQIDRVPEAHQVERYESGASYHEITEDAFRISGLKYIERETIAVRVCSTEPLLSAMAKAIPTPFTIADTFVNGYAYVPEKVLFVRSEGCLSSKSLFTPAIEIWTVPKGAPLPQHLELLRFNQIKLVALGKIRANRGVRDYRAALQRLIQDLRANPASAGVVFGYFLERPSPVLRRRLRRVTRIFQQSGLPADRYLVRPMRWNDEVSTYPPDLEPRYPSVFVVEVLKGKDSARK